MTEIYTKCPACGHATLTINDGHLLCTWIYCPDPTLIDRGGSLSSEHLPIEQLRVGMMAKVTHPKYAGEYPDPVEICGIERHPIHGENISAIDAGCVYDGWKAVDLLILTRTEEAKK